MDISMELPLDHYSLDISAINQTGSEDSDGTKKSSPISTGTLENGYEMELTSDVSHSSLGAYSDDYFIQTILFCT